MSRFVLVHGAWHGAWCWERVLPRLRDHGHQVQTITLAGLGDRASELSPAIGLEDHVRDVAEALDRESEPVVLVGHSYSGLVVRDAALQRPGKVSEVVLVEGWIGPPGNSLLDLAPGWFADGIRQTAHAQGDGWRIPVPDPAAVGVSEPADVAWLRQRMTEHPLKTFTDPAGSSSHSTAPPMRAVLASPGPVPFADMAASLGIPTQQIEGGHDLMVTSPHTLADVLIARP
jgi:pimeloyl-ACP methyl ester carboxylesterase